MKSIDARLRKLEKRRRPERVLFVERGADGLLHTGPDDRVVTDSEAQGAAWVIEFVDAEPTGQGVKA